VRKFKMDKYKKIMSEILKFVIFVSLFFSIHFLVWNFSTIKLILNNNIPKNIVFFMNDFETVNWQKKDNKLITGADPMLLKSDINKYVNSILIDIETIPQIPYVQTFYTNEKYLNYGDKSILITNSAQPLNIRINDKINDLRIDLGDNENVTLINLRVILNPICWNFSFSILFAIILIYFTSKGLLFLQRSPTYKINNEIE